MFTAIAVLLSCAKGVKYCSVWSHSHWMYSRSVAATAAWFC